MAKSIACKDVGPDCEFTAQADTVEELLRKTAAHASGAHGINEITPELAAKVQSAIKDA